MIDSGLPRNADQFRPVTPSIAQNTGVMAFTKGPSGAVVASARRPFRRPRFRPVVW